MIISINMNIALIFVFFFRSEDEYRVYLCLLKMSSSINFLEKINFAFFRENMIFGNFKGPIN